MSDQRLSDYRVRYFLALEEMIRCGQLPLTNENGKIFRRSCEEFRIAKDMLINLENKE